LVVAKPLVVVSGFVWSTLEHKKGDLAVKKKVLILAIVICVLALVGVGGASAGGGEDFDAGTEAATEYDVCLLTSNGTVLLMLDFDGQFVMGMADHVGGPCGTAPVLGDVDPPYAYLYRDWATDSPCVEGVFTTNQIGGAWGYEWINTSGGSGTGTNQIVPCP
jgi:hypothetical protein